MLSVVSFHSTAPLTPEKATNLITIIIIVLPKAKFAWARIMCIKKYVTITPYHAHFLRPPMSQ